MSEPNTGESPKFSVPALMKLRAAVGDENQTVTAKRLRCSQAFVSLVLAGTNRPGILGRGFARLEYGVPEEDWLTEEERASLGIGARVANDTPSFPPSPEAA